MRRQFQLAEEDEACLTARSPNWEAIVENNTKWVIVPDFTIPEGAIGSTRPPRNFSESRYFSRCLMHQPQNFFPSHFLHVDGERRKVQTEFDQLVPIWWVGGCRCFTDCHLDLGKGRHWDLN